MRSALAPNGRNLGTLGAVAALLGVAYVLAPSPIVRYGVWLVVFAIWMVWFVLVSVAWLADA